MGNKLIKIDIFLLKYYKVPDRKSHGFSRYASGLNGEQGHGVNTMTSSEWPTSALSKQRKQLSSLTRRDVLPIMKRLNSAKDDLIPIYIFLLLFAILLLSFFATADKLFSKPSK